MLPEFIRLSQLVMSHSRFAHRAFPFHRNPAELRLAEQQEAAL